PEEGNGHDGHEGSAVEKITSLAREGLTTMPARGEESTEAAASTRIKEAAEAADLKVKAASAAATAKAQQVADALQQAAVVTAAKTSEVAAAANQVLPDKANEVEWARWTADQLSRVPSIQLFGTVKLADLVARGPVQAQAVWRTAQAALGQDYGQMTVSDLLAKFTGKKN